MTYYIVEDITLISSTDFIRQSLELHLFFARIMKEHSFFLEIGFTPKDYAYIKQAGDFREAFTKLLSEAVSLSGGMISPEVLQSGEIITRYTLNAEMASSYYTGVPLPSDLTKAEADLINDRRRSTSSGLEQRVFSLNQRAIRLINELAKFKENILSNVITCKMFTVNYPLLIDHILREARFYMYLLQRLQSKDDIDLQKEAMEQELFWNQIMGEHAKFIRGLLDPTEEELISTANDFGNEFDQLVAESTAAMDMTMSLSEVTNNSLNATMEIRDFKEQGTKGILDCKVKSIIIPLLGDHTLREASHYLRLLKAFETI